MYPRLTSLPSFCLFLLSARTQADADTLGAHTWCCTFYKFAYEQMHSDMHSPLYYHTEDVPCPKNPVCSTYVSLSLCSRLLEGNFLVSTEAFKDIYVLT
jgi:hypothetical protein